MNEIIEYIPDLPPTDLTLLPTQNRSMLGVMGLDWIPFPLVGFFQLWRWN